MHKRLCIHAHVCAMRIAPEYLMWWYMVHSTHTHNNYPLLVVLFFKTCLLYPCRR